MSIDCPEVLPHPSEPGLLQLAPAVLDKLLCDEPISDHLTVEPQPFARGKYATVRRTHRTIRVAGGGTREEWYAAKYQRKQRRGTSVRHGILHEAAVLYLLRHEDHVVQLRGLYESSSEMILLLQLAPHGELQRLVDEAADGVGEAVAQECIRHTLLALAAMHTRNLAHLDLKPQNLLLMAPPGPGCCVKLCDFGIAREMRTNVELREVLGTPDYVAPEVLQYEPICLATDMWSVGVLAYVLLSGHSPFAGDTKQETFLNITQGELDFPEDLFEGVSSAARDFMGALIQLSPQSRLTVKEALNHTWLSGFSSLPPTITGGTPAEVPRLDGPDSRLSAEQATSSAALTPGAPVTAEPAGDSGEVLRPTAQQASSGVGRWAQPHVARRAAVAAADSASLTEGAGVDTRLQEAEVPRSRDATQKRQLNGSVSATPVQAAPLSHVQTNNNNSNEEKNDADMPRLVPKLASPPEQKTVDEKVGDAPQLCTSTATISLKCQDRPAGTPSTSPSHAAKPKLPPKPCNLASPGATSPKKLTASKPPVARKPAVPECKPRSDGTALRPVPCRPQCVQSDPRASEQVGSHSRHSTSSCLDRQKSRSPTSGSPTRHSTSFCLGRQKSTSPTSGSPRGSPQPSASAKSSPRLSRSSRASAQPVRPSSSSPQVTEAASSQFNRSCRASPDTARKSGESPRRNGSFSRSPQLSRAINSRVLHPVSKEGSPQPSGASRRSTAPSSSESRSSEVSSRLAGPNSSSPVVGRKLGQSPSRPSTRGTSMDSPSPSRRPFSSSRMSSESPPPFRKSWPAASPASTSGDAANDGGGRPSRYRHSSSSRGHEAGTPHVSRGAQQASPTRRLQESPNRNCCRPRLEDCNHHTSSLRAASPSPPRPATCTRSPRAARTIFARNVEALHKGAPTNQPLKPIFNLANPSGGSNTKTSQTKSLDPASCDGTKSSAAASGGCALSPASRKTPSHSPPMFQPAPKKSNTVSDFFTSSCSLRARDCSEKSDGELVPFSGIVETSHPRAPATPPGGGAYRSSRHPPAEASEFSYRGPASYVPHNRGTARPAGRDRLPLHAAGPKPGHQPKPTPAHSQPGTKPVPKPRPAHLTIKSPGVETLQCPPVSSCFAVFSSSSLSSPENSTHNSFSSSQSSGSLPSRQCLSPCSTSSSCSDFSFTKPWPDNAVIPGSAAVVPFSLKLQRDKENDRNALNSPTEGQKNLSWLADAAGDERVSIVPQDDSAMEVDPYSSLEADDEAFGSDAVVLMRRDEDFPQSGVSHC